MEYLACNYQKQFQVSSPSWWTENSTTPEPQSKQNYSLQSYSYLQIDKFDSTETNMYIDFTLY